MAERGGVIQFRIGVNLGDIVIDGNDIFGDGVNVAARLEGVNKEFRTTICISHSTFREAGENLCVRPIDEVTVKGRRGLVPIYELMGAYGAGPELEPTPQVVRLAELTRGAHAVLLRHDRAGALEAYRAVLCEFPDDPVAQVMVKRLTEG